MDPATTRHRPGTGHRGHAVESPGCALSATGRAMGPPGGRPAWRATHQAAGAPARPPVRLLAPPMTEDDATGRGRPPSPAPAARRVPMALATWAVVVLVLLLVLVLLVVKVTRGSTTIVAPPVTPAPPEVVRAVTTLPASVFDAADPPPLQGPAAPLVLPGGPV